jgi:hypothetical protein
VSTASRRILRPNTHSYVAIDRTDHGGYPLLSNGNLESGLLRVREIMRLRQRTYPCGLFALP